MSRKTPTTPLPPLTAEDRARALERAMDSRMRAYALKRRLKAGEISLADALDDPDARRIRAEALIRSLPGVGNVRASQVMAAAGIARSRRVSGIGKAQRSRLLAVMDEVDRKGFGAI